jgi:hypothetical protein
MENDQIKIDFRKLIAVHNFSYPQAGFWWLIERKIEFEKAAYRGQFIGKPAANGHGLLL